MPRGPAGNQAQIQSLVGLTPATEVGAMVDRVAHHSFGGFARVALTLMWEGRARATRTARVKNTE
jgi:hypothetical protein